MQSKLPLIRSFTKKHPRLTLLLSAFVLIAALSIISGARFDTDVTRLIPVHAEKTARYFSLLETFGGMEKTYLVFSSDSIMDHTDTIDAVGKEITSSGLVRSAEWKIPEATKKFLREVYAKKAPLLLSGKEMEEFTKRLSPEGMSRELEKTRQRLTLPGGQELLAQIDPLNLFEIFSGHMKFSGTPFDFRSGYFLTPDGRHVVMILTPLKSPRDIAFSEKLVGRLETILGKYAKEGLKAVITGSHAITLHEASVMKSEIVTNIIMSLLGVALIFLIFFRSLKGLLYVMLPVSTAIVTTMGMMLAVTGALSEITGAFAGLITGLGIDLGIVLYVRYLINSSAYADRAECMDKSISDVYRGITTGVITTALTFLPMVFSSFKGIRDLGLLTGLGMIFCWVFLFGLFSLLIRPSTGKFVEIKAIGKLAARAYNRPYWVISVTAVITLLLVPFIPRVPVTGDITKLGTTDNKARQALEELKESYLEEQGVFIIAGAEDLESVLRRSLEIKESLSGKMTGLFAAGDILPPLSRQEENLRVLSSLDAGKIVRDFNRKAAEAGFDVRAFGAFTEGLKGMLANRAPVTVNDLEPVRDAIEKILVKDSHGWKTLITGNLREGAALGNYPGLEYTGPAFIKQELLHILKKDAIVISIIGLLLVNIVLFIDFRRLFYVILCQIPVFFAIICVLGIMGLSGISLNFMNAIVFVMLAGIGTDYTVHLLHRYLTDRDISAAFLQTGKAVLVAGLTTLAGFGTIGFSSYKGLATMGQVAAIGTMLCVLFSLTLIPSLLKLHENISGKR
ncbi:MAG: MMPL family transporter [Nitrospirota bacterium]|nr:MMPL family transporter [Nitrospirota bacterium]